MYVESNRAKCLFNPERVKSCTLPVTFLDEVKQEYRESEVAKKRLELDLNLFDKVVANRYVIQVTTSNNVRTYSFTDINEIHHFLASIDKDLQEPFLPFDFGELKITSYDLTTYSYDSNDFETYRFDNSKNNFVLSKRTRPTTYPRERDTYYRTSKPHLYPNMDVSNLRFKSDVVNRCRKIVAVNEWRHSAVDTIEVVYLKNNSEGETIVSNEICTAKGNNGFTLQGTDIVEKQHRDNCASNFVDN